MSDLLRVLEVLLTRVWREDNLEGALADLPQDFEWVVPGFPGSQVARGPEATLFHADVEEGRSAADLAPAPPEP